MCQQPSGLSLPRNLFLPQAILAGRSWEAREGEGQQAKIGSLFPDSLTLAVSEEASKRARLSRPKFQPERPEQ